MSVRKRQWTTAKGDEREAWIVDYADQQGTRRLKTFKRKKDADAFAASTHVEVREGTHVADRATAMRAVIAALQDLGFILERANEPLGVVTASRFAEKQWFDVMGVTVTVRMRGEASAEVRINAVYNNQPVTDAEVYRNFFTTLERSLFVERS